jgi:hypothetical protein
MKIVDHKRMGMTPAAGQVRVFLRQIVVAVFDH